MDAAEVRAAAADNGAEDSAAAALFETWLSGAAIGFVALLKSAALAADIAVIRFRISAGFDAGAQDGAYDAVDLFAITHRKIVDSFFRIEAGSPEYLVRIN